MAFSLRKNSDRGGVGLDIDGRYLAAAQVDGGRVVRAASRELPDGLFRDGEVVNADQLADALKDFASEADLPKNVRLGVANQQIVVRHIELPRIEDATQRDAAVRFQAAEAIAMPLDEAVLDHQVVGYTTAPDGSPRMQVVIVAARSSMVEGLLDAAKKAGLRPEGIDLDAFALIRTLAAGPRRRPTRTRASTATSRASRNLAIAVGPTCYFTRPLAAVWDDDDAGSRLADEIRLSIDYYMTQPQARPVGDVVLSGPGSVRRRAGREPRPPPRPARPPSPRRSACSTRRARAPARIRTASRSPPVWRWERRHEGRKPHPDRAASGQAAAARTRASPTSWSACSASCS